MIIGLGWRPAQKSLHPPVLTMFSFFSWPKRSHMENVASEADGRKEPVLVSNDRTELLPGLLRSYSINDLGTW